MELPPTSCRTVVSSREAGEQEEEEADPRQPGVLSLRGPSSALGTQSGGHMQNGRERGREGRSRGDEVQPGGRAGTEMKGKVRASVQKKTTQQEGEGTATGPSAGQRWAPGTTAGNRPAKQCWVVQLRSTYCPRVWQEDVLLL